MYSFRDIFPITLSNRSWKSYFHLDEESLEYVFKKYCESYNFKRIELLMAINFLVSYQSGDVLHMNFGICKEKWRSTVWRVIDHLNESMEEIFIHDRLDGYESSGLFSNATLIWDTTEIYIQAPGNKVKNRNYNSGKKRRHTVKYDIGIRPLDAKICWFGNQSPGRMADITIYRLSELPDLLNEDEFVIADCALQGIYNAIVPFRSPSSSDEELINYRIDSKRSLVEQVNARIKIYGSMSLQWRHKIEKHEKVAFVIANLYNISIKYHPLT